MANFVSLVQLEAKVIADHVTDDQLTPDEAIFEDTSQEGRTILYFIGSMTDPHWLESHISVFQDVLDGDGYGIFEEYANELRAIVDSIDGFEYEGIEHKSFLTAWEAEYETYTDWESGAKETDVACWLLGKVEASGWDEAIRGLVKTEGEE